MNALEQILTAMTLKACRAKGCTCDNPTVRLRPRPAGRPTHHHADVDHAPTCPLLLATRAATN